MTRVLKNDPGLSRKKSPRYNSEFTLDARVTKMGDIQNLNLTIITVVKDHSSGLARTLKSISQQDFRNWDVIVVVGKSQDLTLSVAREMADADDRIVVVEQVGLGIYSAMNQGLNQARGHFVCFMNAGDQFASPQILTEVSEEIANTNCGVIIGGHRVVGRERTEEFKHSRKQVLELEFAFNRRSGCHQSMFFQTQTLLDSGGFDTKYLLASDFDAVLKVIRNSGAFRVSSIYSTIEPGGAADVGIFRVHREKHHIRSVHFNRISITILSLGWTATAGAKVALSRILKVGKHKS